MNFLNIRVIINGKDIYTLPTNKSILIPVFENHPNLVATDGFHITKPLEVSFNRPTTYYLKIVCAIDNDLLITGIVLLIVFALVGLISDILLFRILSVIPVLYFLFYYYINRKDFIQIKAG